MFPCPSYFTNSFFISQFHFNANHINQPLRLIPHSEDDNVIESHQNDVKSHQNDVKSHQNNAKSPQNELKSNVLPHKLERRTSKPVLASGAVVEVMSDSDDGSFSYQPLYPTPPPKPQKPKDKVHIQN